MKVFICSSPFSCQDDATEAEPAAEMTDETYRRSYDRGHLAVSTTRCSPRTAEPNGYAIGGARSGGEQAGAVAGHATAATHSFGSRARRGPGSGATVGSVASRADVK